jgi:hypothetical protein
MTLKSRVKQLEDRFGFVSPTEPQAPSIEFHFVRPVRDADGNNVYGGEECDSHRATIDDLVVERRPEETLATFKSRVLDRIPGNGAHLICMVPDDEPKASEQQ